MDNSLLILLDAYQADSRRFAQYGQGGKLYCLLGLASEFGEYLSKMRVVGERRDDAEIDAELGDCWWMLANLAHEYGWTISACVKAYKTSIYMIGFQEALFVIMGREAKALRGDANPLLVTPELIGGMVYDLAARGNVLQVTTANIRKLQGRLARGTIKGEGDNR